MADFIHKDIAERILLMPLRGITIADGTDTLTFLQLEKESSYKVSPITRTNDKGMPITIAYEVSATIYIPENNYGNADWINYHLARFLNKPVRVILVLGDTIDWPYKPASLTGFNSVLHTKVINFSTKLAANRHFINMGVDTYLTAEVEGVEYRPRLIIKAQSTIRDYINNRALSDETTGTSGNIRVITNILSV